MVHARSADTMTPQYLYVQLLTHDEATKVSPTTSFHLPVNVVDYWDKLIAPSQFVIYVSVLPVRDDSPPTGRKPLSRQSLHSSVTRFLRTACRTRSPRSRGRLVPPHRRSTCFCVGNYWLIIRTQISIGHAPKQAGHGTGSSLKAATEV